MVSVKHLFKVIFRFPFDPCPLHLQTGSLEFPDELMIMVPGGGEFVELIFGCRYSPSHIAYRLFDQCLLFVGYSCHNQSIMINSLVLTTNPAAPLCPPPPRFLQISEQSTFPSSLYRLKVHLSFPEYQKQTDPAHPYE